MKSYKIIDCLLLFILSFSFRIIGIDHRINLSWDEISLWYESLTSFRSPLIAPFTPFITALILKISDRCDFEFFRYIFITIGSFSVVFIYLGLSKVVKREAAVIGSLIWILTPLTLFYSQEARPYSFVLFASSVLLYSTTSYLSLNSKLNIFFISICSIFFLNIHLGGLGVIMGVFIGLAITSKNYFNFIFASIPTFLLGLSWIFNKPSFNDVGKGIYQGSIFEFLRSFIFGISINDINSHLLQLGLNDLIIAIIFITIGLFIFRVDKKLIITPIFSIFFTMLLLYFSIGNKSHWPWLRYVTPAIPSFILIFTLCINELKSKFSYLFLILYIPGFLDWTQSAQNVRAPSVNWSHAELDQNQFDGIVVVTCDLGYGDESERTLSYLTYYLKNHNIPIYLVSNKQSKTIIPLKSVGGCFVGNKEIGEVSNNLKPGKYAIFPHSFVEPEGPYHLYGDNKPGCESLVKLSLASESVLLTDSKKKLIDVCLIK